MTRTITQRELRNDSGEIMRALDRGEDFIVTRNGVAVGELRPVRRHFVARERIVDALGPPPRSTHAASGGMWTACSTKASSRAPDAPSGGDV